MSESVEFEPILVLGIIEEEVGAPTAESGLYDVPVRLSAEASKGWGQLFCTELADSMQPFVTDVHGDRAVIHETTIDRVVDRWSSLQAAAERANDTFSGNVREVQERQNAEAEQLKKHKEHVAEVLNKSGLKALDDSGGSDESE